MVRRSKFSERIGALPVPSVLQTDGISDELRTSLWNLLLISFDNLPYGQKIIDYIWVCNLGRCNDDSNDYTRTHMIKGAFFKLPWYKVLDIIEDTSLVMSAVAKTTGDSEIFREAANQRFEEYFSGVRFIDGKLVPITNEEEIKSIEESIATANNGWGAGTHIAKAVKLLSQRPNPDYANSIKESISAVEAVCKKLTGEKGGGIGPALDALDKKIDLHPAFKEGINKLYGYTCDEDGIRHPILDKETVGFAEAKFMLVACSALVNYILAEADRCGLLKK